MIQKMVSASAALRSRIAVGVSAAVLLTACIDGPVSPAQPEQTARYAKGGTQAGTCNPDSKLIGRILVSSENVEGTWWYITSQGMIAAGIVDPEDQKAFFENVFGLSFSSLQAAADYVVAQVAPSDANGNDFVCAYKTRGTRAHMGDPNLSYYFFGLTDDR